MKKIGKLCLSWDRRPHYSPEELQSVDKEFEEGQKKGKVLILGTLIARSGTMWLCDIFNEHKNATGVTERYFEAESFYRYVKYYDLPIDTSGIITLIKKGIIEDWKRGDISLVFSPYFSHGILDLREQLQPKKIIFAVNDPEFTVQSIYNKGLFKQDYIHNNPNYALGYQPVLDGAWNWLFGRVVPKGEFYKEWLSFTRLGKCSWWGNQIISDIYQQIKKIPKEEIHVFHLKEADQNYKYYCAMAKRYGLYPLLSEKKFLSIKWKRVKPRDNKKHEWNSAERREFEMYTKEWYEIYRILCGNI